MQEEKQSKAAQSQLNKEPNKQPDKQKREKAMLADQIPRFNQLSPLWQDFYYQVINKVES